MSKYYTECEECHKCLDFCSIGNISCPCESGECPNEEEMEEKTLER